ncbi:TetR/AcrR family transcriptional regulator C-terminal domain-containing protein [Tenggerimyces flavus]|uniref:TetR/AcrR family transcriptional regulator C-terminal domain-containing protein n=1 Tax=Tenggerimyces flavus TaxID=1708749 RepID=A0ABV7YBC3_9ACTN|nr:TetR/AcrR family transcriptional regulator C-terminal domain-containing protein [Tenggerimyces flavus]MBM7787121.1 TetR/AcrR family tetracycline transcriptional repressor [Tenggerimyces flavus]
MAMDVEKIVTEAVALLDADGLEGVTLRKLAARLEVKQPSLYWHLPNKAALVNAIAERILDDEFPKLPAQAADQPWQDWLTDLAVRLRRALLAHQDGARIISAAHFSRKMAALSELAIGTLTARGIALHQARLIVLTVEHFTVGHTLAEQSPRPESNEVTGFDLDAFTEQHPMTVASITEYFGPARTVDDLFRDCLDIVVAGAMARSAG